jgi:hypothetical protein
MSKIADVKALVDEARARSEWCAKRPVHRHNAALFRRLADALERHAPPNEIDVRPVEQMRLDQMTDEQHRECGCSACLACLKALARG